MLMAAGSCARLQANRADRCAVPKVAGGVTCVCGPPHGDLVVPETIRTQGVMDAAATELSLIECVYMAVAGHEAVRQTFRVCPAADGSPELAAIDRKEADEAGQDVPSGSLLSGGGMPAPVSLLLVPKVMLAPRDYLAALRKIEELVAQVERAYGELHRGQLEFALADALAAEAAAQAASLSGPEAQPLLSVQQRGLLDLQLAVLGEQRLAARGGAAGKPGLMGAELALREAMGLAPEDGRHLVAAGLPESAPPADWPRDAYQALWQRADLRLARGEVYDAQWKSEQPAKRTLRAKHQQRDPKEEICQGRREFFEKAIALRMLERQTVFELVRAYRERAAAEELLAQRRARQAAAEQVLAARAEEFRRGQITWEIWLAARREANDARLAVEDALLGRRLAEVAYLRGQGALAIRYGIQVLATPEREPKDQDKRRQARIEECIRRTLETMQLELGEAWPAEVAPPDTAPEQIPARPPADDSLPAPPARDELLQPERFPPPSAGR